jgi:uncharacterized protein
MLRIAAGLAALSLIASAAQAQTAAPPDPQRLALAKQIFEAQGGAQNAVAAMKSMQKPMLDIAKTPEAKQRVAALMDSMAKTIMPHLFDEMAGYYAADFTEDQLRSILAFYQSPTGQALRANAPVLAQQIGGSMARMMPKIQLSMLDKVCGQVECSAEQQQQLAQLKQAVPADQRF